MEEIKVNDCIIDNIATAVVDSSIKSKCADKNNFKNYLKRFDLNYLTQNVQNITKVIQDAYNTNRIIRKKLTETLNGNSIDSYVKSIISELGEVSPDSEEIDNYQKDQVKSIDLLLHGEEKHQFINHAKDLIVNSLYIKTEINDYGQETKYFINSQEDVSDSLKTLQKELIYSLLGKYSVENNSIPQDQILTDLYKNKNKFEGNNRFTYLLLVNFDNIISELTNGLVSVDNDSDIYKDTIKYSYSSKLDVKKNFGEESVKVQFNPGISNYITNIKTKNGTHLNTTGFYMAFDEIIKTFPNISKLYENIDYFESLLKTKVQETINNSKDLTSKNNIEAVYWNVFDKTNKDSLLNIHNRTKEKYPKLASDLYTMLCNSTTNLVKANYTAAVYDEITGENGVVFLEQKTVNQHKINIEENIINSFDDNTTTAYLDKYFEKINLSKDKKIQLKSKEGVLHNGSIIIEYNGNTPKVYFITNNSQIDLTSNDSELNSKVIEFIESNNEFIKDSILIDLKEYNAAFRSVVKTDSASEILKFVGATALTRAFNYKYSNEEFNKLKVYATFEFGDKNLKYAFSQASNIYKPGTIALTGLEKLAEIYSIIFGDRSISYVVNPEKNKLPVFKNFSLFSSLNLWYDILKNENIDFNYENTFANSLFNDNFLKWDSAVMTSVSSKDPNTGKEIAKPITDLSRSELFYNGFVYNFLNTNKIGFQPVVYSDKSTISNLWVDKKLLLTKIKNETSDDLSLSEKIVQFYYDKNRKVAQALGSNILKDISTLLGVEFNSNQQYDDIINAYKTLTSTYITDGSGSGISKLNNRISEILKENPTFEFIEEIHYSLDKKGNVVINPTLLHFFQMFLTSNQDSFLEKINIQKAIAVYNLNKDNFSIRSKDNSGKNIIELNDWGEDWHDKNTEEYRLYKINNSENFTLNNILNNKVDGDFEIHPQLEQYLLLDMLVSDQFALSTLGMSFIHNSKLKSLDESNKLLKSFENKSVKFNSINQYENTQTIAMYKRAVGYTANMFTFAKGLNSGIPDKMNFAIIDDAKEMVLNAQNTSDAVDIHDGSIFFTSLVNDMMQASLGELTVNKKHFKPYIILNHSNYCTCTQIKSAGFTINNYTMREGVNSSQKYATIFKKMTNIPFPEDLVLNLNESDVNGASYLDSNRNIVTLENAVISNNGRTINVDKVITDIDGNNARVENVSFNINSNYDLWQMFGGAYSYKNGVFTEESLSRVSNLFATNPRIKDFMTHFLVNSSACKTGITNRNGRNSLLNSDIPFNSFSSSSFHFGMQLDASHGVDGGDVTGSVQQISALIQGGFTEQEANDVYKAIGRLIIENINAIKLSSIDFKDPKKERELLVTLSKFVINNLSTRLDDVGLTDAIVKFAEEQNNSIIPFNDPNVINLFTSVLNSVVSKNIIKRTSSGVPAIQAPTSELVSVYEDPKGNIYTNSEIYKNGISLEDVKISQNTLSTVKPGDVINLNGSIKVVAGYNSKIKSGIKHQYDTIGLEEVRRLDLSKNTLTKLNSKGRNLRGQNFDITLENGRVVDLFDLGISKLSYYLEDSVVDEENNLIFSNDKTINEELQVIYNDFLNSLMRINDNVYQQFITAFANFNNAKNNNKDILKSKYWNQLSELLNKVLQDELVNIDKGKFKLLNEYVNIKDLKVKQGECILGNAYATKFGLSSGDFLGDIINNGESFFKKKLEMAYTVDNSNYDLAFMSLSSPKIYVNVVNELDKNYVDKFKKVTKDDGTKYIVDSSGNIISPFDKNYMQVKTIGSDIVIETLKDGLNILDNSDVFGYIKVLNNGFGDFIGKSKIVSSNFNTNEYLNENGNVDINKYDSSFNSFIERQSVKLLTSFKQGLEYVAIRIPDQSKQSSMNLKVVAFTPEDTNVVYIPSDAILYQGSDFDIDKLYLMGASINKQGIYDAWSPFFNYSSTQLLKLSHKLPIPTNISITTSETDGLSIASLIDNINVDSIINNLSDDKQSLESFITLLKEVNNYYDNTGDTKILNLSNSDKINTLVSLINKHNEFNLSFDQKINAVKNKIYGMSILIGDDVKDQIFQTTQMSANIAKTIAQLAPSEIECFSNNNVTSKYKAQHRTQVGKSGIGINASGTKGYSGLSIYFQNKYKKLATQKDLDDILINVKGLKLKEDPLLKFSIPKVFNTNLSESIISNLRNELLKLKWEEKNIPIDGFKLTSVLLTAATDNAKDPILQGINCTSALNSMYISLISLGADINEIGTFFTSPFMVELSKHTESDFTKEETYKSSLKNAIDYMFDGPKKESYGITNKKKNDEDDFEYTEFEEYNPSNTLTVATNRYEADRKYWNDNIANNKSYAEIFKNKKTVKENLKILVDVTTEFTTMVKLLSIDGGIKNNSQEYYEYVNGIESFIKNKLDSSEFSLSEFLNDPEIAASKIKAYENVKSAINILDVVDSIPHVKAMLQAMIKTKQVIDKYTVKGVLGTKLMNDIKYTFYRSEKLPSNTNSKIYKFIDQVIVNKFLKQSLKTFNIKNVSDYYNYDHVLERGIDLANKELDFTNYADVMTYKHWFEQDFIPALKNANTFKGNKLINSLITTSTFNSTRTERISLLTTNTDTSLLKIEGNRDKYMEYVNEFFKIQNQPFTKMLNDDVTVGDAFVLYNLIVNQNRHGKYSFNDILQNIFTNFDLESTKKGILNKFLTFEANLNPEDILESDYDVKDLHIRFIEPNVEEKGFTKIWNKSKNKIEVKRYKNLIEFVPNDDALEMYHLNKSIILYEDKEYNELYKHVAEAIKQNKLSIEFRCD